MFDTEKLKPITKSEHPRNLITGAFGRLAVVGEKFSDIPQTYRSTNSLTASLAVAAIHIYQGRLESAAISESQSLLAGQEPSLPA